MQTLVVCALAAPVEVAELAPCSPLELVFARGTSEEGLGIVGTPLAAQLRSLVSGWVSKPRSFALKPDAQ